MPKNKRAKNLQQRLAKERKLLTKDQAKTPQLQVDKSFDLYMGVSEFEGKIQAVLHLIPRNLDHDFADSLELATGVCFFDAMVVKDYNSSYLDAAFAIKTESTIYKAGLVSGYWDSSRGCFGLVEDELLECTDLEWALLAKKQDTIPIIIGKNNVTRISCLSAKESLQFQWKIGQVSSYGHLKVRSGKTYRSIGTTNSQGKKFLDHTRIVLENKGAIALDGFTNSFASPGLMVIGERLPVITLIPGSREAYNFTKNYLTKARASIGIQLDVDNNLGSVGVCLTSPETDTFINAVINFTDLPNCSFKEWVGYAARESVIKLVLLPSVSGHTTSIDFEDTEGFRYYELVSDDLINPVLQTGVYCYQKKYTSLADEVLAHQLAVERAKQQREEMLSLDGKPWDQQIIDILGGSFENKTDFKRLTGIEPNDIALVKEYFEQTGVLGFPTTDTQHGQNYFCPINHQLFIGDNWKHNLAEDFAYAINLKLEGRFDLVLKPHHLLHSGTNFLVGRVLDARVKRLKKGDSVNNIRKEIQGLQLSEAVSVEVDCLDLDIILYPSQGEILVVLAIEECVPTHYAHEAKGVLLGKLDDSLNFQLLNKYQGSQHDIQILELVVLVCLRDILINYLPDKINSVFEQIKDAPNDITSLKFKDNIKLNNEGIPERVVEVAPHIRSQFIRKLPEGYKASAKAKELAETYGYSLNPGETFVQPANIEGFTKEVSKAFSQISLLLVVFGE